MKKILLTVTGFIAVAMLFSGVGYAAATWLNFEGEEDIQQSKDNIDEILNILEEVNNGKITAEEGVTQLTSEVNSLEGQVEHLKNLLDGVTGENPGQKIQFLKDEVERLFNDNAVLTTDLAAANKTIETQKGTITTHLETIEGNKETYDALEQTRIDTQNKLDNAIVEKGELETELSESQGQNADLQALIDENSGYIQHLKDELVRANDAAESVNTKSADALKEAQQYQSEEE